VLLKQIRSHRSHIVTKTAFEPKGEVGFDCLSMDGLKYLFLEDRDQPLPSWMAELEDVLKCPVCLETFIDPPIYLCENGHCFCSTCHEPLKRGGKECPICRGRLTNARNVTVEKMLEKLPKTKCRYEDCQFKRADVDVVHKHEIDCLFRLVECAHCQEGIPLSKLCEHIGMDHQTKSLTLDGLGKEKRLVCQWVDVGQFVQLPLSIWRFDNRHLEVGGNNMTFFINIQTIRYSVYPFSSKDEIHMFWVSFCGGESEAAKYEYTLKIQSSEDKKDGGTKYLFTGTRQCVSCEVSHEDMKEEMEALLINKKLVKAAEGNEKKVEYRVIVTKKQ